MRFRCVILLALLVAGGSGCSPFQQRAGLLEEDFRIVPDVPYRAQQARNDCGPAALASLLAHRGKEVSVATVAGEVYTPALEGTLLPDMENYARRIGFATRSGSGDLALLRRTIDSGRPVLALIETGLWVVSRPHYIVIFGYDAHGFLAHVGARKGVFIDDQAFSRRWDAMNRLYLYLE